MPCKKRNNFLSGWFDHKPALDAQAAFNALPDIVMPGMPPEVAALVEVKASREIFEKHFAEIEQYGGLPEVVAYIEVHPPKVLLETAPLERSPMHYIHLPAPGPG